MALNANLAFSPDYKVGFIYIGPPGDHGWNYQHDVGRKVGLLAEKSKQFFKRMFQKVLMLKGLDPNSASGCGHDFCYLIWLHGSNKRCKKFPKVKFEHATCIRQIMSLHIARGL